MDMSRKNYICDFHEPYLSRVKNYERDIKKRK